MNYRLSQIAEIIGGTLHGNDLTISSIATDSRSHIPTTALFCAINGVNHNGNDYINDVAHRGVRAFLCNQRPNIQQQNNDISYIIVDNTLKSLQNLAAAHRQSFDGEVIAITGSGGKTIVKEWFAQMWDNKNGKLLRSPQSYNSQLGVALSLLMIEGSEKIVFIEAGISAPKEMAALEDMIKPTLGVFTTIGDAHAENFDSIKHKLAEKEILFKGVKHVIRQKQSTSITNSNLQTALDIYDFLKLTHKEPSNIEDIAMRLEVRKGRAGSLLINDSYSCDITSLTIALDFADRYTLRRRVVVLSDMANPNVDYGDVRELLRVHKIDLIIAVGTKIKTQFHCDLIHFNTKDELMANLQDEWFADAVVLIKGARKYNFEDIATKLAELTHTTVLEVNLATMIENLDYFRAKLSPKTKIMAMVKADSYGAGAPEIASTLQHHGVNYLAVAFADEGLNIRNRGVHTPIVVLNSDPESYQTMIKHRLEPEIYSLNSLKKFIAEANNCGSYDLPIHIKLDTGMHRLGFMPSDTEELITILNSTDTVYVATIFSHLAAADSSAHDEFTARQIDEFKLVSSNIIKGLTQQEQPLLHICNSAGIERLPEAHFDMVRLGIGLYQHKPVSRLVTHIVQIKEVAPPETVGYMRNGELQKPSTIAILPIGYADGLSRGLGAGAANFNVGGQMCPTIGNICMDTCMIDVTDIAQSVKEGDEVEIFGQNPTAEELAQVLNTIDYEILTNISKRIKRVYIN